MSLSESIPEEKVKQIRNKPSVFVKEVLGIEPYQYQQRFLNSDNPYKCFAAGRQVGKSLTLAWLALHKFATRDDHNVLIFSRTERQVINLFHNTLKGEMDRLGRNMDDYDRKRDWNLEHETKHHIEGSNDSEIFALPAARDGATLRGFTADTIIVDEAAHINDNFFTEIIGPMLITTDGDYIVASTPWGRDGYFWDKFNDENWHTEQLSSYDNPDANDEFIDNELASGLSNRQYQQEILGEFPPAANSPFPPTLVDPCMEPTVSYTGNQCYLGVDISGGGGDRTVLTSLDDNGNVFNCTWFEGEPIKKAITTIYGLNETYGYDQILVDETSLGQRPVEELEENLRNVEGFTFSLKSRASAYNSLKMELEKENLSIPEDPKHYRKELTDMQTELTPRKKMKFKHPEGGHDDFSDSAALAVYAWREGGPKRTSTKSYSFNDGHPLRYRNDDDKDGRQAYSF